MARGKSGRIVLEVDPDLKRSLYLELEKRQQTLKEWFVAEAQEMLHTNQQEDFFHKTDKKSKASKRKQ